MDILLLSRGKKRESAGRAETWGGGEAAGRVETRGGGEAAGRGCEAGCQALLMLIYKYKVFLQHCEDCSVV